MADGNSSLKDSSMMLLTWDDVREPVTDSSLKDFLQVKTRDDVPEIKKGNKERTVILQFKNKKNADFLKTKYSDDNFWRITTLEVSQHRGDVKVSNLPVSNRHGQTIYHFFNNKHACGVAIHLQSHPTKVSADRDWCVLRLKDGKEANKLIDEQRKLKAFDGIKLELSEFYEELYTTDTKDEKPSASSQMVTVKDIERDKMEYLKQCYRDKLKTEIKCDKIDWPKDNASMITFHCSKSIYSGNTKTVEDNVKKRFNEVLNSITIVKKEIKPAVWEEVLKLTKQCDTVMVKQEKPKLVVIGLKESVQKTLSDIDGVKPPLTKVTKRIDVRDKLKLEGFEKLGILQESENKYGIKTEVQKDRISITGTEDRIKDAEMWILEEVNELKIQVYKFPSPAYGKILLTPMMQDTIMADIDTKSDQAQWNISHEQLVVYTRKQQEPEDVQKLILGMIVEDEMSREGSVVSKKVLSKQLEAAAEKYDPYVVVTHNVTENTVTVKIVCGANYLDPMQTEVKKVFDETLLRTESIMLPEHVFNYIDKNSMDKIKNMIMAKQIKEKDCFHIDRGHCKLSIVGSKETRLILREIILTVARDVKTSWKPIEDEGISQYFTEESSQKFLKSIQESFSCKIETATKREMKERDISCIVLLKSGQALFAVTGGLSHPSCSADAIVNPTSVMLQHRTSLSRQLISDAGADVSQDLKEYVKTNGPMQPGHVYSTSAGRLPCQRILHAVIAADPNSHDYEDATVKTAIENIFKVMNKEMLKSVAMALPWHGMITVVLRTIEECISQYPDVREVYFYDINPHSVRQIKNCMDRIFSDKCFHLPVENIALGKGHMSMRDSGHTLERKGSRTLPLPGEKRIVIVWGSIAETSADILVNTTPHAPRPRGKIFHSLNQMAGFDLSQSCERAFKDMPQTDDGTMVKTNAGSLGCQKIYHIKICDKWPANQSQELSKYTETCLNEALRENMKSIAFPTIGTADCNYPKSEVAKTMITTIGNFMKLHMSGDLKEVKIVVFKRDKEMTIKFEDTIQKMYSKRPHRLEAVIEESVISKAKMDEEKKDAKAAPLPSSAPAPSVPPAAPVHHQAPGRSNFTINSGKLTLIIVKGRLEKAQGDIIVCTTPEFPKLRGVISDALKLAGGSTVQKSIETNYPKGYPNQGIPEGDGGKLKCKRVYYIKLKDYSGNNDLQAMYSKVQECLDHADKAKHQSIIFPTIGTGNFKYPEHRSADKTFEAIRDYFLKGPNSLRKVVVVVFEGNLNMLQTFQAAASKCFNIKQGPALPGPNQGPMANKASSQWTVPGTQTSISLKYGQLEQWRADVILDTTTSFPNLNGAIPDVLMKAAGPGLLNDCKSYHGNIGMGDIAVTKGHNLSCKNVFHYLLPQWQQANGKSIIQSCITECLSKMQQMGLSSIALPTIGTGGYKYDAGLVASGIYSTAEVFGKNNPNVPMSVTVVLFMPAANVNQIFDDELQKLLNRRQNSPRVVAPEDIVLPIAVQKKGVRFSDEGFLKADQVPGSKKSQKGDFLLFRFMSDDPKKIDSAFEDIQKHVKNDSGDVRIPLTEDKEVEIMKETKFKTEIEQYGVTSHVSVLVDLDKKKEIMIRGLGEGVNKCHLRILQRLQEQKKIKNQQVIGQHVYKYLEWCYAEDQDNIWVPYPKHICFDLEEAHTKGETEKKFKDSNDKYYVVDFNAMKESEADSKDKSKGISVNRFDLQSADDLALPGSWDHMGDTQNLCQVDLQKNSQEFREVEASFKKTLKKKVTVHKIQRIQNKTLYRQYQTKKKQLESKFKGPNLERCLWHGAKEDSEMSILSNGFNRGFSGQTHAGNVWYGYGCYFAVQSDYAEGDFYSPKYKDDMKRMYLVDVLTGNTSSVPKGYSGRWAPLIPNSQDERYDSVCDNVGSPQEFVIFNDTQAYPKYLITFK